MTVARDRRRGEESRTLAIGPWSVRLDGLDAALAAGLDTRWGPFVECSTSAEPSAAVELDASDGNDLLPAPRPGERYRIDPVRGADRAIASYGFTLAPVPGRARSWRLALGDSQAEPAERRIENGARFVVATLALDAGGFALHAAGVLVAGRGFLLAGPSRAGKSTAVRQSHPAASLGDDFGVLVPSGRDWHVVAVPFDNSERIEADAVRGSFPLGRVLRVFQAERTRIDELAPLRAATSLVGVAAFPWAVPGHAAALAERAHRLAAEGRFAHLHFARDADLWSVLAALS